MEIESTEFVFQVDSPLVEAEYEKDNYIIRFDDRHVDSATCVVYFGSNDIYYPNTEEIFRKRIVEGDAYEWYNTRLANAYKHIFLRDVHKQWYLSGINSRIYSPELLLDFLRAETEGYKVVMIGSSAGGFAAVLFGSLLGVDRVFSFNGQFEIATLLQTSNSKTDPLLFRYADSPLVKYFDLKPLVNHQVDIYYFNSLKSDWDRQQMAHISEISSIRVVRFNSRRHGIPFVKDALPLVINLQKAELDKLAGKLYHPIGFSIHRIGLLKTINSIYKQLKSKRKRRN